MLWFRPSGAIPLNWTSLSARYRATRPQSSANDWNFVPRRQNYTNWTAYCSKSKRGVTISVNTDWIYLQVLRAGEILESLTCVCILDPSCSIHLQIVKSPTSTVYSSKILSPIALQPRGVSPHICILYESAYLLLHAGETKKSVSFVIRVQQRIKLDLLHSVNKNHPNSMPYSSKTNGGVTPTNAAWTKLQCFYFGAIHVPSP